MRKKSLAQLVFVIFAVHHNLAHAQLANPILGSETILTGVKNVIGGILAFDSVHGQCVQKTLCSEFADEIIEATAELDPVKRTYVYKPHIKQRKGKLRWIGDTIYNAISGMGRRLGIGPGNRRQAPSGIAAFTALAASAIKSIPLPSVVQ